MDRTSAPVAQQGGQASTPHQTSSQTLGSSLEHPLSIVPVLSFPKDWWHLEVTVVWQFDALISDLILIVSWSRASPTVLYNSPLKSLYWPFPSGMLGNSQRLFSFPLQA